MRIRHRGCSRDSIVLLEGLRITVTLHHLSSNSILRQKGLRITHRRLSKCMLLAYLDRSLKSITHRRLLRVSTCQLRELLGKTQRLPTRCQLLEYPDNNLRNTIHRHLLRGSRCHLLAVLGKHLKNTTHHRLSNLTLQLE